MVDTIDLKRGGRVKSRKSKAKATATATNTVHIHLTKRQAAPRRAMSAAGGNMAMEKSLGRMFQQLGTMSFHPPLYSSIPPVTAQSVPVVPPEKELPQQQANIINLRDLANHPTLDALYRDKFVRDEWDRQEAFSHASHLPASIDHGSFSDCQSIPFNHMSYGDENNVEKRAIDTNGDGQMSLSGGFYGDYEDFATLPAEPMLKEAPMVPIQQPMAQSVNNLVPFTKGQVIKFPPLRQERSYLGRHPRNVEELEKYGAYGYGYSFHPKRGLTHKMHEPRADERSFYSGTESREGRLYYGRPLQLGNQGGGR